MECCVFGDDCDEPAKVYNQRQLVAKKPHRCTECREEIPGGAQYERVDGLWDGHWSTYKTCLSCVEIRDHFAAKCGGHWVFEQVWSDLEEYFFPDMKAGGPCMEGLSPAAKARLFERRLAWLHD